ncbi:MAG: tRNA lysidine(34) synthetase TilS [Candidatus Magnetoovum sp. WYHC-5]|nr:tRNA lysidine(34) synthetase TilS [Candidatus Magnetoovum sp. WYHC-5]
MTLIDKVCKTLEKFLMLEHNEAVLVCLSGGPDSVCLLHVLHEISKQPKYATLRLFAVYVNHGLRPDEIGGEISLCTELCIKISVPFTVKHLTLKGQKNPEGKQALYRQKRYEAFEAVAHELGIQKIALGHNLNDTVETFFINLMRGSGLAGLAGIPPVRQCYIRPLIEVPKPQILDYLYAKNIPFAVDSSNLKDIYARNKLRETLMPTLKLSNLQQIAKTSTIIRQENDYLQRHSNSLYKTALIKETKDTIELSAAALHGLEIVPLRRVMQSAIKGLIGTLNGIELVHIEYVVRLLKNGKTGQRVTLPKGIRVIKNYDTLLLTTTHVEIILSKYALYVPGEVLLSENGQVIMGNYVTHYSATKPHQCIVDGSTVMLPLIIRAREAGDYFYPIGLSGRKKVQDYFVDVKIPRDRRNSVAIVCSGNDIVWIAGYRMDERFKITDKTTCFLKLEIL